METPLTPAPEVVLMTFDQAIKKVIEGKKINRIEWDDRRTYYLLKDGLFQIHKAGEAENIAHPFALNDGDFLGTDWIVVE